MGQSIEPGQSLVLRTDGGSRGNPGPAAAGVIIEDASGRVVARGRRFLGHMTNNQAEYRALILGLKALTGYRPRQVTVYLDSELVVNQMNGRYRVRDEQLRPLFEEAKSIAATLPEIRFAHVPRAQNQLADALANEALDAHAADRSPPGAAAQHRPAGGPHDTE
jgi:ribonuclease HI